MQLKAISARRVFDGEQYHDDAALIWQGDEIQEIIPISALPEGIEHQHFNDALICPGFIDLQVNGGGGIMLNSDSSVEGIETICAAHRQFGTAYLLPTLISTTPEHITLALQSTQQAIENGVPGVLGIHLEGPWLNPEKRGAHNAEVFYSPTAEQLSALPWLTLGHTLVTCAFEQIDKTVLAWLNSNNITLSCGHSNATYEQLSGEKHSYIDGFTHLFNAMSPFEGRSPGVVGAALSHNNAWCSIITDGIHVHPQSVLLAHKLKPKGKLVIVTDAMASIGSDNNQFELDGETIKVIDGKLVNSQGSLAGAHIGMDQSVANVISWGIEESEALKMASLYPALAIKAANLGRLSQGFKAAATILTPEYISQAVVVDGQLHLTQ